jgi:hypothetical protein
MVALFIGSTLSAVAFYGHLANLSSLSLPLLYSIEPPSLPEQTPNSLHFSIELHLQQMVKKEHYDYSLTLCRLDTDFDVSLPHLPGPKFGNNTVVLIGFDANYHPGCCEYENCRNPTVMLTPDSLQSSIHS